MRALVASVAVSLLIVTGCGDDDAPVTAGTDPTTTTAPAPADTEQGRLDQARAHWEAAGVEDYRLTWAVQCFCPKTIFIDTVVDGEVVDHRESAGSDALDDPGPKTVETIFDEVQAAIDEEPATLEVTYDEETGAVTRWWADYRLDMADEEQGLEVLFERLDEEEEAPTPVPVLDPADLTVAHPCGTGFQLGTPDQRAGLFIRPTTESANVSGTHSLADGTWRGTVRLGSDLFANWCDDVLEPDEPRSVTLEEWPVVEGAIDVVLPPDGEWGPATLAGTGLVAERPDGQRVPIGDIVIENSNHGFVAG